METLISLDEAAQIIGMSRDFVEKQIRLGRLAKIKLGSATRLRESDVEAFVEAGIQRIQAEEVEELEF